MLRTSGRLGRRASWHRVRHGAGSQLASAVAGGDGTFASQTQTLACDDVAAFSLRDETPRLACLGGSLELSLAVAPKVECSNSWHS